MLLQSRRISRRTVWLRRAAWLLPFGLAAAAWQARDTFLSRYQVWREQEARGVPASSGAGAFGPEIAYTDVPGSLPARRLVAELLEAVGSPQALRLRREIALAEAAAPADTAALLACAARFRDQALARRAREMLSPAEAARVGQIAQSQEGAPALAALRAQALDAAARRDYAGAERAAAAAAAAPEAAFSDRLRQADLEILIDKRPFEGAYARLASVAAADGPTAARFARWLMALGRAGEAQRWIGSLPAPLRRQPDVAEAQAEAAARLGQWDQLESLLIAGAWGPASADAVRLALSARLIGTRAKSTLELEVWDEALRAAGADAASLAVLERLAECWNSGPEREKTLLAAVRAFPEQAAPRRALLEIYRERKDTGAMRETLDALRAAAPKAPGYRREWALLGLLIEPSNPAWDESKETLRQLYEADSSDPDRIVDYAFALAQAGRVEQALAVAAQLSPAEHEAPEHQPYLAYICGLARQRSEFQRAQARAGSAANLLPEENFLFTLGREALDQRPLPGAAKPAAKS